MLISSCLQPVKCPFPINLEMMKLFIYLLITGVVSLYHSVVQDLFWVMLGIKIVLMGG